MGNVQNMTRLMIEKFDLFIIFFTWKEIGFLRRSNSAELGTNPLFRIKPNACIWSGAVLGIDTLGIAPPNFNHCGLEGQPACRTASFALRAQQIS